MLAYGEVRCKQLNASELFESDAVSGPNMSLRETIPAHETLSMCQIVNIWGFPIGSAQ